jgi:hypothetical protein
MPQTQGLLRQKLRELCKSASTLLWLEGAKHDRILDVTLMDDRLVLRLSNGTTRVVAFEKFAVTAVGLQFWSQGRPGVLYKWEQVPKSRWESPEAGSGAPDAGVNLSDLANVGAADANSDGGDEPPPDMAA